MIKRAIKVAEELSKMSDFYLDGKFDKLSYRKQNKFLVKYTDLILEAEKLEKLIYEKED